MKTKTLFFTAACFAACALCIFPVSAAEKESPAPEASASPAATAKPARPIPYRGKIESVAESAKTFTVGKHTIKVIDATKITKNDAAATISDIVAGEEVRGSYWKKEDGSLEAKSVKLGAKSATGKAKRAKKEEKAEAEPSATPKE